MYSARYALPKNSQAWHNAVNDVAHLLPSTDHSPDVLRELPIFAVMVVVDAVVLSSFAEIDALMVEFIATLPKWHMQMVYDDEHAKANAHQIDTGETLRDFSLSRYLLLPNDHTDMTPSKREAAARIIDDQLTTFLNTRLASLFARADDAHASHGFHGSRRYVDVHILNVSQVLTRHKLICFDMDSTLIEQEVIVELAKKAGVSDKVAEITERAMRGEIDFATSFAERVALLADLNESVIDDIINNHITLQTGAMTLMRALKAEGYTTVLVSGGFEPFARHVAQKLGMDEYYANPLLTSGGTLTGYVDENILDGKQKAVIAERIAERMAISTDELVCVGDGANDLPMMAVSDIGIAYRAKPIVQSKADAAVNITGLEGVLYALGHRFDKVIHS